LSLILDHIRSPLNNFRGLANIAVVGCLCLGTFACDRLPTEPAQVAHSPLRAVTLTAWTANEYGSATAAREVERVAAVHANAVWLIVTAYQTDVSASTMRADDLLTPTPASVRTLATLSSAQNWAGPSNTRPTGGA
jgi:hypothetical protein